MKCSIFVASVLALVLAGCGGDDNWKKTCLKGGYTIGKDVNGKDICVIPGAGEGD